MRLHIFVLLTSVAAVIAFMPLGDVRRDEPAYPIFNTRDNLPNLSWLNGTCVVDTQAIAFKNCVGGLTVTGEISDNSQVLHIFVDVNDATTGAPVLQFSANMGADMVLHTKRHFGDMIGGIKDILFTTEGNWTTGTVNGRDIKPFSQQSSNITFTDGTPIPNPIIPENLLLDITRLPQVIRETISGCPTSDPTNDNTLTLLRRRQGPIGVSGQVDDTGHAVRCLACLAVVTATEIVCCVGTFGLGCGACSAAAAVALAQCHNPGTGFGQGCCPVACGSSTSLLGIVSVVFSCCFENDSCLDPSSGRCCAQGLQPCGGRTCCPSDAPCRDPGICCPTNRNTCITSQGPVCCQVGEQCVQGQCCPTGFVRNGACCSPDVCCIPGTVSRCFADGMQTCINGQWVFTRCEPPRFCLGIPVANAGVFCIGPPNTSSG